MFTKYGYTIIAIVTVISFILFSFAVISNNSIVKIVTIVAGILLLGFTLQFFRDPERKPPGGNNIIVSPADGRILSIKTVSNHKYVDGTATQISVFMSPLNVHVNRIPITGTVDYLNYFEGKYLPAFSDKADLENERSEIGIKSKHGKVFFTQVAGAMARRIVYEIKKDDNVTMGDRFGMIKFGSRMDVVVPEKWIVKVKKDDKVSAGETILFEIKE